MDKRDIIRALYLTGFAKEHWSADWRQDQDFDLLIALSNDNYDKLPNSVLLSGILGAGKTSLLSCFCQVLFKNFSDMYFRSEPYMAPDLFARKHFYITHTELSKSWEHEFDDNWTGISADDYMKAPVLFLDDLGAAPDNQSGRNIARMEDLIDWRWRSHLKTFIASNISLADLQKPKNSQWNRIARRLAEKNWMIYRELRRCPNLK